MFGFILFFNLLRNVSKAHVIRCVLLIYLQNYKKGVFRDINQVWFCTFF